MKFLHAADLHIDSPLRGLERYEGAPVERIRNATRHAFDNLVRLAVDERVAFVVLAGDLFDGDWQDMETGLWTAGRFRKLEKAGIRVFLLRGNHDAASKMAKRLPWPANVREFSCEAPETIRLDDLGVALHGQGFPRQEVTEDLAAGYPDAVSGMFNVGVLHTNLTGDVRHDPYAPTTEETLVLRGYDYWALGHVHARQTVREEPCIAYSGTTQGRHVNERGEKGCLLVTVTDGHVADVEFRPTDTLRWHVVTVELSVDDTPEDAVDQVRRRLEACHADDGDRLTAARVCLTGATHCHTRLVDPAGREEVVTAVRDAANHLEDVWVEKVLVETTAPVDVDRLRRSDDLLGELLRDFDRYVDGPDDDLRELADVLEPLAKKAGGTLTQAGIRLDEPDRLRHWLRQAEGILLARLSEDES